MLAVQCDRAVWERACRLAAAAAAALAVLAAGCSAHSCGCHLEAQPPCCQTNMKPLLPSAPGHDVVQASAYQEPVDEKASKENKPHAPEQLAPAKEKIRLSQAVALCVAQNFRLLATAEKVRQSEAELVTASVIPNPTLFADYQLIPLQRADIDNQLGPPQVDTLLSVPIDWLLFGKRVAAMQAAQLGIAVTSADYADMHRQQVANTVDTFYEVLADEEYLKLARKNHEELLAIEKLTADMVKNNKAGSIETDRIKLAVLEAFLEVHERERTLAGAKARLRPLIGRSATDADFEVEGTLIVTAVVPPPKLADALALADAHRPDLVSGRHEIAHSRALVEVQERNAKPQVSIVPGLTYQDQRHINGFRNGSLFDIGISTTLPLTDRNRGNILRAQAREQEAYHTYLGDRADALAEVEATLANYEDAVEDITQNNSPVTLKAAHDLRKSAEDAYGRGDRKLVDLLDAHRAYQERLAHIIEFEANYWRTLNKLNMVVGLQAYDAAKGATVPVGK